MMPLPLGESSTMRADVKDTTWTLNPQEISNTSYKLTSRSILGTIVDGFNSFEKYARQNGSFSLVGSKNKQMFETTTIVYITKGICEGDSLILNRHQSYKSIYFSRFTSPTLPDTSTPKRLRRMLRSTVVCIGCRHAFLGRLSVQPLNPWFLFLSSISILSIRYILSPTHSPWWPLTWSIVNCRSLVVVLR